MAKVYGINGYATGKLGNQVLAIRNGEQIARQYQPIVSNPNTEKQVGVRARLKLMSQLSAALASFIAIPREGAKSPRNIFTSVNFGNTSFVNSAAEIDIDKVQLTKSSIGLGSISVERGQSGLSTVNLAGLYAGGLDRIMLVCLSQNADGTLSPYSTSEIDSDHISDGEAVGEISLPDTKCVVYAYGMQDVNEKAKAYFANLTAPTPTDVAKIVVNRVLTMQDITLTKTIAAKVAAKA